MLPSADAVFAPQLVQALELAPLANEPDGHAAHAALPVASLYVPALHPVQGPPSPPVYPNEQMHAVTATLPVTEIFEPDGHVKQSAVPAVAVYLPTGHEAHAAEEPLAVLYVPAVHAVQLPPLAASPLNPAEHSQLMLPAEDTALLGQLVHTAEPTTLLYVPGVHATQLPSLAAAFPVKRAGHAQVLTVFPSTDTTVVAAPTEHPQNTTAGRCSPISARRERGFRAMSKGRVRPPGRPKGGLPHAASLHAESRDKSEDTQGRERRWLARTVGIVAPIGGVA